MDQPKAGFEKGHTVILYCDSWPSKEQRTILEDDLKSKFPGAANVVVLPAGFRVEFIKMPA